MFFLTSYNRDKIPKTLSQHRMILIYTKKLYTWQEKSLSRRQRWFCILLSTIWKEVFFSIEVNSFFPLITYVSLKIRQLSMLNDSWPWWKIILQLGHSGDRVLPHSLLVLRQVILLDFLPVKWDKSFLIAKVGFSFLFFSHSTSLNFRWIRIYSHRKKKENQCLLKKHKNWLNWKIVRIAKSSTSFCREEKRTARVTHRWSLTESCEDVFSGQLEPGWEVSFTWAFLSPAPATMDAGGTHCSHSSPSWSGLVIVWIVKGYVISELYKCRLPLSPYTQQTPDCLGRSVAKMEEDLPVPSPAFSTQ